jgi:hypothetical protein
VEQRRRLIYCFRLKTKEASPKISPPKSIITKITSNIFLSDIKICFDWRERQFFNKNPTIALI